MGDELRTSGAESCSVALVAAQDEGLSVRDSRELIAHDDAAVRVRCEVRYPSA